MKLQRQFWILSFLFLLVCFSAPLAEAKLQPQSLKNYHFSTPHGLQSRVEFWKKIYTVYSTDHAVIHDDKNLDIIYEVIKLRSIKSSRKRDREVDRVKKKYKSILKSLARKTKRGSRLTREEQRVKNLIRKNFYRAARNIRVQIGQKDRFRDGLIRSGRYMSQIRKIFKTHGLPWQLTVLPHVESSFQLSAYSSAGAAGIWQFTRSTGRLFLKIGYEIDERLDPILATDAAARLLKKNFKSLGSWPLAITAYNHGLHGMKRAKRRYGDNLVKIIQRYRSRSFGFASQNFYCEFLAALEVTRNRYKYFPNLKLELPRKNTSITFRDFMDIQTAMKYFRLTKAELSEYNPALRKPVINGRKRIPKGFVFQVPEHKVLNLKTVYAKIPTAKKYSRQIRSKWYRVQRGDTLSEVAARFRTSVATLKSINHINRRNLIYPGQVIQLPHRGTSRISYRTAKAKVDLSSYSDSDSLFYKVRRHDNISNIARRHRVDPLVLAAYNRMDNPDTLFPGQVLKIPLKGKTSKSSLKVIKKADRILIQNSKATSEKTKRNPAEMKIKFVNVEGAPIYNLQNRPAFLPVVFENPEHKSSKIGTITVDFDETLSHYADWARLPLSKLRRVNHYRRNQTIKVHSKIKVPFSRIDPEDFEDKRQEYHKGIREDFFNNYEVQKTLSRKVKKGETVWDICNNIYSMPFWLLSMYNPDQDINALDIGDSIVIPIVTSKSS